MTQEVLFVRFVGMRRSEGNAI